MVDRQAWEAAVLAYDPLADDKDDGRYVTLSDKIVTAKALGACIECFGPIIPGTRIRSTAAVLDGKVATVRTCHECCKAMAEWAHGDEQPMIDRYRIAQAKGASDV